MDYTQPDQPTADEQPSSTSAPGSPPTRGAGQAPEQVPYQPQGGYLPPPPPPPRKGFNWLACCGITCVVLLIVGGLVGYCGYRVFQPFFSMGMQLQQLFADVQQTDILTIKSAAMPVDTSLLTSSPATYEGQWLELEGQIVNTNAFGGSSFSSGNVNTQQTTNYMLEENVILMDITQSPAVGGPGDSILAYGQIYSWDLMEMEKMPFIGKAITEEMKKDPSLQGNTQVVFFVAKEVTLAAANTGSTGGGDSAADAAGSDTGWE